MIQYPVAQAYFWRQFATFMQILVDRIPARVNDARNQHFIADLQGPDFFFREWEGQCRHDRNLIELPLHSHREMTGANAQLQSFSG